MKLIPFLLFPLFLFSCQPKAQQAAAQPCKIMAEKGFKHLYNMQGGWLEWSQQQEAGKK